MGNKGKQFALKYAGIKQHDFPILYHLEGDYSVLFEITNTDTPTYNQHAYSNFKLLYRAIIDILGESYTIQKHDLLRPDAPLLTYLSITRNPTHSGFFQYNAEVFNTFKDHIKAIQTLFHSKNLTCRILDREEINVLVENHLRQNFSAASSNLDQVGIHNHHIAIGNQNLKIVSLIDVDESHFPLYLNNTDKKLKHQELDILSFLDIIPTLGLTHVLYNQVIRIPSQKQEILKLKQRIRLYELANHPGNAAALHDCNMLLEQVKLNPHTIVYPRYDIFLLGSDQLIAKALKHIQYHLHKIGVVPTENSFNQYSLFSNSFLGHSSNLNQDYDLFPTTVDAATSLLYKHSPSPSKQKTKHNLRQVEPFAFTLN